MKILFKQQWLKKALRRSGQTMMDYVLIISLVAAAIAGLIYYFGDSVGESLETSTGTIKDATGVAREKNPIPTTPKKGS